MFRPVSLFQNSPPHVKDEIFRSLRGQDLLNCAILCKSFYEIISKFEHFMDSIVFKTGNNPNKDYDLIEEYLKNTTRAYKHLKIEHENFVHMDFLHQKFDWRSLQISRTDFTNDTYMFIDQFAPTIHELEFHNIRKLFDIDTLGATVVPEYTNLKSFKSNCFGFPGSYIVWLFRFRLRPIKQLTIAYDAFKFNIFEELDPEFNSITSTLNLTKLIVTGVHDNPSITPALLDFLQSQRETLEELEVTQIGTQILETVFEKLKIKKLTIGKRRHFDYHKDVMKLVPNSSINEIELRNEAFPLEILDKMFKNATNLVVLRVTSVQEESLNCATDLNKSVQVIYIDEYIGDPNDSSHLWKFNFVKIKELITKSDHYKRLEQRWAPQTAFQKFKRLFVYHILLTLFGGDPGTCYNPNFLACN